MSLYKFALKGGTQLEQNVDKTTYQKIIDDKKLINTSISSGQLIVGTPLIPTNTDFITRNEDALILANQQVGGDILTITDADTDLIATGRTLEVTEKRIFYTITGDTQFETTGIEFTLPSPDECYDKLTYMFHCEDNLSGIEPYVYFNDAHGNLNFDPTGTTINAYCPLKIEYWQPLNLWMNVLTCMGGGVGPAGPAGTSGTSGLSGTAGTSGAQGIMGTAGTSGASGTAGTSGQNGSHGTSGTSGVAGTSGTSGTSGA